MNSDSHAEENGRAGEPDDDPTAEQFGAYESAFSYFNEHLFGGKLLPAMLNFSRKANSKGFYCAGVWAKGQYKATEITLNPDVLVEETPKQTMSTLVHEMVHHWQECFGKLSRLGYHNKEWASKLVEIGLHPSDTGEQGGNVVGQKMSHYIVEGGPFELAFAAMREAMLLPWTSAGSLEAAKMKRKGKWKTSYCCPSCGVRVWGKGGLDNLFCSTCDVGFEQEPDADDGEQGEE